jgi:chitodextrinase
VNGIDLVFGTAGNSAPSVTIDTPANNATFMAGEAVTFTGTAADSEDGSLTSALAWSSSLDGALGNGGTVNTSSLSVGTHVITASVSDSGGLAGSQTISVTINP